MGPAAGERQSSSSTSAELFQAQAHIYSHVSSYMNSMALRSAVELGIADAIQTHGGAITLPQLVSAVKIDPTKSDYLYRLMRILVHSGFFSETGDAYLLTPSSKLLLKSHPNSLSAVVKLIPRLEFVTPCFLMGDWLREQGEKTAFETAHGGTPFWEYSEGNPEFNSLFNEAMANDSGLLENLVVGDCGLVFQGIESLVDVGGGTGTAGRIISETFPGIRCKVLDLPQVIGDGRLANSEGNLEFVAGDMFDHVPSAQAVLLKCVLHDWNNEECVKILKKCKEAISAKAGEGGKVIVIDIVVNEKNDDHELAGMKLRFDMLMMLLLKGKERSEKEWEGLFLEAGFKHYKITPLFGFSSLIEVFP
ncbi:unnamed protein product [Linum trigynum]|uniref:Uncharacterized protein n=1 Tax=Linum trigynum TaxID=586398 RepID=A0AAV2GKB4_9ROSI